MSGAENTYKALGSFNEAGWYEPSLHLGKELLHHMILYNTGELIVAASLGLIYWAHRRHLRRSGRLFDHNIAAQITSYYPVADEKTGAKIVNKKTGNGLMDQRIRPFATVTMDRVDERIRGDVLHYLHKAIKSWEKEKKRIEEMKALMVAAGRLDIAAAIEDDNFLFHAHLKKVVPEKEQAEIFDIIRGEVQKGLTQELGKNDPELKRNLDSRKERPVDIDHLWLIVLEEGRLGPQMRLLLLDPAELRQGYYPQPQDVRVEINGAYIHDDQSYLLDRCKMMQRLRGLLQRKDNVWIAKQCHISVSTGGTRPIFRAPRP